MLDSAILLLFRDPGGSANPIGPFWLQEAAVELTALGGYPVVILLVAFAVGYLLVSGRWSSAWFLGLSVIGGSLLSSGLKLHYARPRPDLVEHLDIIHTASFPSGHATVSMVSYLTAAAVITRSIENRRHRVYIFAASVLLVLLVGTTRVYLGVHWPSDVLAGWFLGLAWAGLCWLIGDWLTSRWTTGFGSDELNRLDTPGRHRS